uniref:Uncharacterized protein n=1 Tax=Rhizophora mucronata TaxID=61149 RepID=A0A2P2NZL1_RHIMU
MKQNLDMYKKNRDLILLIQPHRKDKLHLLFSRLMAAGSNRKNQGPRKISVTYQNKI